MRQLRNSIGLALLQLSLLGCDRGMTPTTDVFTPDPPASTATSIPAGTTLQINSGETGNPVAGASFAIDGMTPSGPFSTTYVSGPGGTFVLDREALLSPPATLRIEGAGFLIRQTLLRSPADTTLTLWPRNGSAGLDEAFTSTLVYSTATCPAANTGASALRRLALSAPLVAIAFGSTLQDAGARSTHQAAAARLNQALEGAFTYSVSASGGSVVFTAGVDPSAATCTGGPETLRAATTLFLTNGEVSGGTLTYCSVPAARNLRLVLHELGHTFGLRHSSSTEDVMYCTSPRPDAFSAREVLAMRLMRQRRSGNRFPDDDRQTTSPLAAREAILTTICEQ
jgi:hypothetical protein